MELAKLIVSALTPLAVAVFGILLLRRIESIKSSVAAHSDFRQRWAAQFFDCCQRYMQTIERDMAILMQLSGLANPNDEYGTRLQKECSDNNPLLAELELRIRRSVVFAPITGEQVRTKAFECLQLISKFLEEKQGNFDLLFNAMDEFNRAARTAHAEMVGVVEPNKQK